MKIIEVYTSPGCSLCTQVKKALDNNNIEYKLYNIADDESFDRANKKGIMAVPTVIILENDVETLRMIRDTPQNVLDQVK